MRILSSKFACVWVVLVHFLALLSCKEYNDNLKKINEMNLLLPHILSSNELPIIQYKLTAYNGCYEWFSSNSNILKIEGIPDISNSRCQSNALISIVNSKPIKQGLWISAKDKGKLFLFNFFYLFSFFIETGDVLKIEAKIAEISRLDIITKARTIDVGEMQVLDIIGYDTEENKFSTLEGIKFEWNFAKCENIFEIIPLKVLFEIYIIYFYYLF